MNRSGFRLLFQVFSLTALVCTSFFGVADVRHVSVFSLPLDVWVLLGVPSLYMVWSIARADEDVSVLRWRLEREREAHRQDLLAGARASCTFPGE